MNKTTDPRVDSTEIPTDEAVKLALMRTARLHHDMLSAVTAILRVVLVIGGILVAVRIADNLFM